MKERKSSLEEEEEVKEEEEEGGEEKNEEEEEEEEKCQKSQSSGSLPKEKNRMLLKRIVMLFNKVVKIGPQDLFVLNPFFPKWKTGLLQAYNSIR